jgi:TetR/AcrR family transcriptional repressor of nem operon
VDYQRTEVIRYKQLSVAAKRFRERGLEGIGVADLMKEAGVTVGGFYKHFDSRDELVVEALATAFQDLDRLKRAAACQVGVPRRDV